MNLKPCPFCGDKDIYTRFEYKGNNCSTLLIDLEICCKGCGIRKKKRLEICDTSFDDINKAMCEAVEDWNRRADEITHCKDCKYLEEHHYENPGEKPYIKYGCKYHNYQVQLNGYCHSAKK